MKLVLENLDGLIWLIILLIPFNLIQNQVHKELQTIFYLITRKKKYAIWVFAILFFPGVVIHEISHLVAAKLLGVKTGRFSIIPKPVPGGQLQMGYVEIGKTDWLRSSLIGAAPLISGGSLIAYVAVNYFKLPVLWDQLVSGQSELFWSGIKLLPQENYFWLLAYLVFVVSSTMLPSDSDRHSWLPLGLTMGVLLVVVLLVGAGPWLMDNIAPSINAVFNGLAMVIGLSGVLHILIYLPVFGIHKLLSRLTGYDIL